MEMRKLGRHDMHVTVIGCGGIVVMNEEQSDANRLIANAFESGIRYFDVAPQYGDAQEKLGPALEQYRDQVVLACKTLERTAEAATAELHDSLAKLRTDHFDIYQMHSMSTMEDFDTAFGPGGAYEAFAQAKKDGLIRLIGASVHDEEVALRAIQTDLLDTVLVPLNFVCMDTGHFGARILDAANDRDMGILALKSMAKTSVPQGQPKTHRKCWYEAEDDPEMIKLLLRYTLSLPGVSAALPPGNTDLFQMALDIANDLTPIDEQGIEKLRKRYTDVTPIFPKIA